MTEALDVIESTRRRFDGERRNPWNEPECGHHYARAMASWACFSAWSGFRYSASEGELSLMPRTRRQEFRCFWSVPSGWGSYGHSLKSQSQSVKVQVTEGSISVRRVALNGISKGPFTKVSARLGTESLQATLKTEPARRLVSFGSEVAVKPDRPLEITLGA